MAEWAGFSEEEVLSMRGENDACGLTADELTNVRVSHLKGVEKPQRRRERRLQHAPRMAADPLPGQAFLSTANQVDVSYRKSGSEGSAEGEKPESSLPSPTSPSRTVKLKIVDGNSFEILNGGMASGSSLSSSSSSPGASKEDVSVGSPDVVASNDSHSIRTLEKPSVRDSNRCDDEKDEREISKLAAFQQRQKYIEEQNRKKKELLAKAISDRKKKTQAETTKLHHIQDELQKLDSVLSTDVGILRNQIEMASLDFMEAQKRYDRAEKEFVEAKLQLFGKLERKELLTEHLCAIIEQNEMRKARKLSELMEKLEMVDERLEVDMEPVLPQLAVLDDTGYLAGTTLRAVHRPAADGLQKECTSAAVARVSPLSFPQKCPAAEDGVCCLRAEDEEQPLPALGQSAKCCLVVGGEQGGGGEGGGGDEPRLHVRHLTAFHTKEAGEDGSIGVQL